MDLTPEQLAYNQALADVRADLEQAPVTTISTEQGPCIDYLRRAQVLSIVERRYQGSTLRRIFHDHTAPE